MRVYVEHDMTVNHVSNVVTLKAGEIVEGPLAVYLVESNCDVTIEQDDRPAATAEPAAETPETPVETGAESHTPGSGEQAEGETAPDPEATPADEAPAEPGAAE